jgi:hypothetical protein
VAAQHRVAHLVKSAHPILRVVELRQVEFERFAVRQQFAGNFLHSEGLASAWRPEHRNRQRRFAFVGRLMLPGAALLRAQVFDLPLVHREQHSDRQAGYLAHRGRAETGDQPRQACHGGVWMARRPGLQLVQDRPVGCEFGVRTHAQGYVDLHEAALVVGDGHADDPVREAGVMAPRHIPMAPVVHDGPGAWMSSADKSEPCRKARAPSSTTSMSALLPSAANVVCRSIGKGSAA